MRMTQKSSSFCRRYLKSKVQGLCSLQNCSLLSVNDDFEGKRNTENLCKRVKCKVYFAILQLVMPNFRYQIYFIYASIYVKVLNITQILDACLS